MIISEGLESQLSVMFIARTGTFVLPAFLIRTA
jgi:hypothetical protein